LRVNILATKEKIVMTQGAFFAAGRLSRFGGAAKKAFGRKMPFLNEWFSI
jgi:hypothetical protein